MKWFFPLSLAFLLTFGVSVLRAQDEEAQGNEPKTEAAEEAAADEPKADEPKAEEPVEEPKAEEPKEEEPKEEEPKEEPADEPKDEPKEEPKDEPADEPKDEPKKEEPQPEADEAAEAKVKVKVDEVLTGLDNPCGVAVQPGTGHVFVADSAAGKVVRFNPESAGEAEDVITDFALGEYGKGPVYKIGPLGLAFLDADTLVVGGGGEDDGKELVYVYNVPEAGKSIKASETKQELGPIAPGDASKNGEGNFYALAIAEGNVYVTSNGEDTKGWVLKGGLTDGGKLETYLATKEATQVDAPVGIAINRKGHLVVGQMGEINAPGDSLLTFYSPSSGKMLLNLETGLHDIAGLAYSSAPNPDRQRLYAVDFAWMAPEEGGLFRIDGTKKEDGTIGCEPVLVKSLDKPTAIAFAPDGKTMYVTVFGTAEEGSDAKPGKLLKISGDGADL